MPEVVTLTVGLPGAGKTYSRVAWLIDDFLPFSDGIYYTNLPLKVEKFVEYFDANHKAGKSEIDGAEVRRRLVVIPRETESVWQNEESGPWEFFEDKDLSDAHIAIDEAHTVIGKKHTAGHRRKWQEFTGELRHRGAELELISQSYLKIADEVMVDISLRRQLVNGDNIPDPIFGIPFGDWHQLQARKTGTKPGFVRQVDQRQVDGRKWEQVGEWREWKFDPYFFEFYDSYATPKNGGKSGKRKEPFQRFSTKKFVQWFGARNASRLLFSSPVGLVCMIGLSIVGAAYINSNGGLVASGETPESEPVIPPPVAAVPHWERTQNHEPVESDVVQISALFDGAVMVADGQIFRTGEKLNGKTIERVDVDGGFCLFVGGGVQKLSTYVDDGSRVERVQQPVQRQTSPTAQQSGNVGSSQTRNAASVQRSL